MWRNLAGELPQLTGSCRQEKNQALYWRPKSKGEYNLPAMKTAGVKMDLESVTEIFLIKILP